MKKIVFDSFALIDLSRQEKGYELVRDLLVKMANDENEDYISAVNVGEIYYMISQILSSHSKKTVLCIRSCSSAINALNV